MYSTTMEKSPEYNVPIFKNDVDSDTDSGFPFDDDVTSGDPFGRAGLRSHLDSLAARHPEFAQHLGGASRPRAPPGSSHAWGSPRKRRGSGTGSLGEDDARSQASGSSGGEEPHLYHQFAGRGFPFDDFPNEFRQHIPEDFVDFPAYTTNPRKNRQGPPPPPPGPQQPEAPPKKDFCCQTDEDLLLLQQEQQPEQQEPNPLQQHGLRNTVDLGQRSRLAAEEAAARGQRSMSAPPEDHRHQQRADMGQYASRAPAPPPAQQPAQAPGGKQPQVRHIPIFVEGRDEPVVNKDPPPQSQQPQQQRQATPEPPVFARTDKPRAAAAPAAGVHGPIFKAAQNFAAPPKQPTPPRQATPPPPPVVNDPITKIQNIQKDVLELMSQVETFVGTRKDKQYVYLDEMLTRNLLKLDDVETEGKENIRQARKEAIKCIQKCIAVLEAKADSQAGNTQQMDVDRTNGSNSSGEPDSQKDVAQDAPTAESNKQNEAASGGDVKEDKTDTTGKENETTANDKQSAPEQTMDIESTAKAEAKPSH